MIPPATKLATAPDAIGGAAPTELEQGGKGDGKGGGKEDWLPDEPRMVYVGNLPFNAEWQELKDFMKQAGTVEFASVLTQDGTDWGRSRGVGFVRYATEAEAKNAIATLNGMAMGERTISVDAWTGRKPGLAKGWGKGMLPFKGMNKGQMMAMWKGMSKGGKGGGVFGGKGWSKGGGNVRMHGDSSQLVYVGNLPPRAEWQELKDHMKQAGAVEFASRRGGMGCIRYSTAEEAQKAIQTLNGSELMGKSIVVDAWTAKKADDPTNGGNPEQGAESASA